MKGLSGCYYVMPQAFCKIPLPWSTRKSERVFFYMGSQKQANAVLILGRAEARVAFMPQSGIRCDCVAERENFGGRLISIIVRKLRFDINQAASEFWRITEQGPRKFSIFGESEGSGGPASLRSGGLGMRRLYAAYRVRSAASDAIALPNALEKLNETTWRKL